MSEVDKLYMIVAANKDGVIGVDGGLAFKCKADMQHFKEFTTGNILIVGGSTFRKDLRGRGLKNRTTIVISKTLELAPSYYVGDVHVVRTPEEALDKAKEIQAGWVVRKIIVIGGKSIYEEFIDSVDEMQITIFESDIVFPAQANLTTLSLNLTPDETAKKELPINEGDNVTRAQVFVVRK